jgi:NADH-quinone oxidoreductase subunit N
VIVLGSAVSLAYYLRVVAAVWMRSAPATEPAARAIGDGTGPQPVLAGGSPELDVERRRHWEVVLVAVLAGAATLALGIVPGPLFEVVDEVGAALGNLL